MLETGLTLNGFRVTLSRTGREALEAASSRRVRRRAQRHLHAGWRRPGTGGCAARDGPEPAHRADDRAGFAGGRGGGGARGASDFIGKPFEISAVVELLRRYLDARREADASPPPLNAERCNFRRPAWWAAARPW